VPTVVILVVLPSVCPTYSAIKTYCETTGNGTMTQCVLSKKVKEAKKQYCGMLGLKINSKVPNMIALCFGPVNEPVVGC
jgi:hypothetical protein